ncbi:hypothetical protein BX070DRAFT_234520 [Coemansia spiralis]|nr:hypothetical protein BX070DRAFT_234520 [Coemansia spiralis]
MPNPNHHHSHHTFPRLQTSPNVAAGGAQQRTPDPHPFALDAGYCSLPHTPRSHRDPHTPGLRRNIWVTMRRDRQSRVHSIMEARSAKGLVPTPAQQESAGFLSAKELPKAIRLRARDSAWLLGQRAKPKTVRLSELANALRTTPFDEDDMIMDSLLDAERAGTNFDPIEQSVDFDAIQEIVSLRYTVRLLLRLQLEHPDAATRQAVDDIIAKINSPKKRLKLPLAQPLATGPSFYFSASKFALTAQLRLFDEYEMDEDSYSSSSEEPSDYEDDGNHMQTDAFGNGSAASQQTDSAAASKAPRRNSRARILGDQEAHAAHLMWARKFAEYMNTQWEYGAPHLFQLLTPLPQCGFFMANTLENIFRVHRSSIKEPEAYYLFAAAAAQAKCYPLVCLAEHKVIAACYDDDGDVYESWLSNGISAASSKVQLLARFGAQLASRPWEIAAQDIRHYVDEYVRIHSESLMQQLGRQRGDSSKSNGPSPRTAVHRSLSTSVVSGAPATTATMYRMPVVLNDFSRKSLEESAIRELLHCIMVMAVGHSLGSFASACGIAPDLDHPSGSFFGQMEMLVPAEPAPGLSYIQPPPSPTLSGHQSGHGQHSPRLQQARISAAYFDQVERNTVDLVTRLQYGAFPDSGMHMAPAQPFSGHAASQPHRMQNHHLMPQPPVSMLRHISGPETCPSAYMRSFGRLNDPAESSAPQFVAYRHMRARKLARYELIAPLHQQQQQQRQQQQIGTMEPHFYTSQLNSDSEFVPGASADGSSLTSPSSPLQMVHKFAQNLAQMQMQAAQNACSSAVPKSVHLSQREDLRWDVLNSYLQQQLSISDDYLGNEVQAARGLTGRPFVEAATHTTQEDDHNVFLADNGHAPLKSDATKPEWERSMDTMDERRSADLKPKSYNLASILSLASSHPEKSLYPPAGEATSRALASSIYLASRNIDVRRFHDAIWHFTLSLYHIYEEYYFYNKYRNETTPDSSQNETAGNGAISVPVQSPDASMADMGSMDVDYESEIGNLSSYMSTAGGNTQEFNIWLTEELKAHIRAVVRNPDSISVVLAQPPIATGLSLHAEEMVHINLIISLAKRQAEIIHGIRAIREYQNFMSG